MASTIERLAILIEAHGGNAIAEFKKVGAAAHGLQGPVAGSTKAMGGLGQAGATAGNLMKAGLVGGAVAAGTALVKFGADAVEAFRNLAQSVRDVQRITGGTAEDASKLVAILDDFEVPVETLNKGFFRLSREIGKSDQAFKSAGFSVAKNAAGNIDLSATLLNISDAYKATEDPAKRATLLTAAFGRGGAELIPILEQGRAGIEAVFAEAEGVGQILSQEEIDKAEEFRLAMDNLSDATQQFSLAAGGLLVPALTDFVDAAVEVVSAVESIGRAFGKIGDIEVFGTNLKGIADKATDVAIPGKILVGTLLDFSRHGKEAGAGLADAASGAGELGNAAADLLETTDALKASLFSVQGAHRAVDQAIRSEAAAERSLGDAQKTLAGLLKAGPVDLKAVESATNDLAAAEKELITARADMATAADNAATAERELADLRSGATAAKNMIDHADDVGKAKLRLTRAERGLTTAQDSLNALQQDGSATSTDLANAADEVTQATFDLHDAQIGLTTTQEEVNRLGQVGAENSPATVAALATVTGAHVTLTTATDAVTVATANVTAATTALGTALAGDPNFSDAVRDARQGVADATQHVADAMYNVAQNREKFEESKGLLDAAIGTAGPVAVDTLKGRLETMLAMKPNLAAFFDPVLADLAAAAVAADGILTGPGGALTGAGGLPAGVDPLLSLLGGYINRSPGAGNLSPLKHAAGGIAMGPTLGIFGEAGPEALIPLDQWTGGGGQKPIVIQLVLDGKVITEVVHTGLLAKQRRGGNLGIVA